MMAADTSAILDSIVARIETLRLRDLTDWERELMQVRSTLIGIDLHTEPGDGLMLPWTIEEARS